MNYARVCAVMGLSILGAACTTAPSADAVAKFSTAVGTTATSLQAGFAALKDVEVTENEAVIERKALCRNVDNAKCAITTLQPRPSKLTPQLLAKQQEVLDGLKAYADKLSSLTDDKTKTLVSSSVKDTGSKLKSLGDELKAMTKGSFPGIDSQTVEQGVTAIGAIGDWLVQEEINKDLPTIIAKNQPYIEKFAKFLNATIGSPVDPSSVPENQVGSLRAILSLKLAKIDLESAGMIEGMRRDHAVGDLDLISEVDKVYEANITRAQKVDAALADVQAAIKKMVTAHAALVSPSNPSTIEQIQSFGAFAERAATAIEAAQKKPQ